MVHLNNTVQHIPSFEEFYYLEEGFLDKSLIQSLISALKRVTSKDQIREIIQNLGIDRKAVIKILAYIRRFSKKMYNDVIQYLSSPKQLFATAIGEREDAMAITRLIAFVIMEAAFLIPLHYGTVAIDKYRAELSAIRAEVEQSEEAQAAEEPTASNTAQIPGAATVSRKIAKPGKWANYTNPGDFVQIVKAFESGNYRNFNKSTQPLQAYADRTQRTIGYGTRAKTGELELSKKEAAARLLEELTENRRQAFAIAKQKGWKLNTNQLNGLTDFAFNRGITALSKMIAKATSIDDLAKDMLSTTYMTTEKGEKKHSANLQARREWEVALLKKH